MTKHAPTERIRQRLERAAVLRSNGCTWGEIASRLGTTTDSLHKSKKIHFELWGRLCDRAQTRHVPVLKQKTWDALKTSAAIVAGGHSLRTAAAVIGVELKKLKGTRRKHRLVWDGLRREFSFGLQALNRADTESIPKEKHRSEPTPAEPESAAQLDPHDDPYRIDPDEIPEGPLSAEMTLPDFFRGHAWPFILGPKGDSIHTLRDYGTSLRYWAQFTGNPSLAAITRATCARYLARLKNHVGANTVYKHWANIERLLRWTGPAGPHNKAGTDLIERPPWAQGPKRRRAAPKQAFTLDEIWIWLQRLSRFARPWAQVRGFDPAEWWRAAILVAYNTAMRPGLQFRARWEWFEAEHVMRIPVGIAKGHDGRRVYFNRASLEALKPLREATGLIFGWKFPRARTTFSSYVRQQQRDARLPENRRLPWYALRRTFATQMARVNFLAMQILMNHAGLGTKMAIEHYIDEEPLVMDALSKLPQPGSLRAVSEKCA